MVGATREIARRSGYGLESLVFDVTGVAFVVVFKRLFASGGMLAGAFPPAVAALLVDLAFVLVAVKMNGLIEELRRQPERSEFAGIVVSGAYGLMTIAQPVVLTAMLGRFGILPADPFTRVSFFAGNAIIFPSFLGLGTERPRDVLKTFGIGVLAGAVLFGDFDMRPGLESLAVLGVSVLVLAFCLALYTPRLRERMTAAANAVTDPFRGRFAYRLLVNLATVFLLWAWWELAVDTIRATDPHVTVGQQLMILYFTGPLLYRASLMVMPPLNWLRVVTGVAVFVLSLVA